MFRFRGQTSKRDDGSRVVLVRSGVITPTPLNVLLERLSI